MIPPKIAKTSGGNFPLNKYPPNTPTIATSNIGRPITGSLNTSNTSCVAIHINPIPATVPKSAARGILFFIHGPINPPINSTSPPIKHAATAADHVSSGSPNA